MTLSRAYDLLRERWPRRSFNIDLEVWHHDHTDTGSAAVMTVEWSIWDEENCAHHRGATLEIALASAVGHAPDLVVLERTLDGIGSVTP